MNDSTTVLSEEVVNGHADGPVPSLEHRVRYLEETVAQLQNTEQLETRIVNRVAEHVIRNAPVAAAPVPESPGFFTRLPRALLPLSVTTITPPGAARDGEAIKQPWAVFDVLVELRSIWRMYVDPRYRLTWMGRVIPLALLAAILTSMYWLPFAMILRDASGLLAGIYVKLADLFLAFLLYKALTREARRYREQFPDPRA